MKATLKLLLAFTLIYLLACQSKKNINNKNIDFNRNFLDSIEYQYSSEKINSLVHTHLILNVDFKNKEIQGTAHLKIKPHSYPTDSLKLHAKFMRIESVKVNNEIVKYEYDSTFLKIKLPKLFTPTDTYSVSIQYVAQPEKVKHKGSAAIHDNKGAYFINSDSLLPNYPVQLWTQCETEEASCWFPTIDAPNQKTTQTIEVTYPSNFVSISNGVLTSSEKLSNNLKKDIWQQKKPHTPYLFALVIGDFYETKDFWRNVPVNYYLEKDYHPYSKTVFGNTPKMIEFFSKILKYDYPWDKYHQVVVREFVSGAMENTGCVIHYDHVQFTDIEKIDEHQDDIIAHELFHHWFGDLVTCESWSNLPLNESFATYGEYLWNEHQYGRSEADIKLQEMKDAYFSEAYYDKKYLIRYFYKNQNDMFDRHSYQKGGIILHHLRKYLGDEVFFNSLSHYLKKNQYKTVELSDLRTAFEEVSGKDLNWFFNQWFLDKGHPILEVNHLGFNSLTNKYEIEVTQKQTEAAFVLPVKIGYLQNNKTTISKQVIKNRKQLISIDCPANIDNIIFDYENELPAEIIETKSNNFWNYQTSNSHLKHHQLIAYNECLKTNPIPTIEKMLNDNFWLVRETAIDFVDDNYSKFENEEKISKLIRNLATSDPKSQVRAATTGILIELKLDDNLQVMLSDSSYLVKGAALRNYSYLKRNEAYEYADEHRYEKNLNLLSSVYYVIAYTSKKNETRYFIDRFENGEKKNRFYSLYFLSMHLSNNINSNFEHYTDFVNDILSRPKVNLTFKKAVIENIFDTKESLERSISIFKMFSRKPGYEHLKSYVKEFEKRKKELENLIKEKKLKDE